MKSGLLSSSLLLLSPPVLGQVEKEITVKHSQYFEDLRQYQHLQKDMQYKDFTGTKTETSFIIARGLFQGLYQGVYRDYDYELEPECFGELVYDDIARIEFISRKKQWLRFIEFLFSVYSILDSTAQYCKFETIIFDFVNFCKTTDHCSGNHLQHKFLENEFKIVSILLELGTRATSDYPQTNEGVFELYDGIGEELGKLLDYMIDFQSSIE